LVQELSLRAGNWWGELKHHPRDLWRSSGGCVKDASRERAALWEAMDEVAIDEAVLVTLHEESEEARQGRTVRTVPAWKWFLGLS